QPPDKPVEDASVFQLVMRTLKQRETVALNAQISMHKELQDVLSGLIAGQWITLKGHMDMASPRLRVHDLAAAVSTCAQVNGHFPRGTMAHQVPADRHGRPYPPEERVGWMIELLPYLNHEDVYKVAKKDLSWKHQQNLGCGLVLIPEFLDPKTPPEKFW